MESLGNPPFLLMDGEDIFNFPLDGEDGDDHSRRFPEFAEEELEWLSNKDAFPAVETGLDIFNPHQNLQSPISVLENSSSSSNNSNGSATMSCCGALPVPISFPVHYPVRARSKRRRRRRREFPELPVAVQQAGWWNQVNVRNVKHDFPKALQPVTSGSAIGRRCQHCLAEKTPQWRAGPKGPKTLCNACGVRYKSGRLVPEYRPANSPTFSSQVHSNSHRKIMEMRRHTLGDNMMVK